MTPAEMAKQAAAQRAAMLARLQPVKQDARSKLGELRAQTDTLKNDAKEATDTHKLTASHSNDLFVTPKELAERMTHIAGITHGMEVLEPSAGTGRIADAIQKRGVSPVCVEFNSELVDHLRKKGFNATQSDFMQWEPTSKFHAVIMNPPFSNGADADHVRRAYDFIMDGGIIVAIMGEGVFFRNDRKAQEFRAWLEQVEGTSEKLPPSTFGKSGTNVNTRLVTIRKNCHEKY